MQRENTYNLKTRENYNLQPTHLTKMTADTVLISIKKGRTTVSSTLEIQIRDVGRLRIACYGSYEANLSALEPK